MFQKILSNIFKLVGASSGNVAEVTAANAVKVDASSATVPVSGSVTVSATNLDIRDLAYSTDSVSAYLTDTYGYRAEITPTNELRVVEPVRLVGTGFGPSKNPSFWTETVANGGTVTQVGEEVTLATNTTANGSAAYATKHRARYIAGSANRYRGNIRLGDTGEENNSRKWGAANGINGAYFELDGTTLYVVTLKNSVPSRVASADWNRSTSVPTLTNNNVYEIYYTNEFVYFVIEEELKHVVESSIAHWTYEMSQMAEISNTNSAGLTTNHLLICRSSSIFRLGKLLTSPVYAKVTTAATQVLKYGPGTLHSITLNSPKGTLITIYDNTSATGNIIAAIDTPAQANPVTLTYEVAFSLGLTVVSTGTWDATIVYE